MGRLAEAAAPTLFALDDAMQPQLIPVEINLEGFPLFSREKTPSGRAIEVRQNISTLDGRTLKQLWRVTANEDFSLPGTYDEDVFVGVMALVKRRGGMPKDGSIRFSVYELIKVLHKSKNGENIRKVKQSLDRIAATNYYSENAFYVVEDESFESYRFGLWSVHFSRAKSRDGRSAEAHTLTFDKVIIRSYNSGYLKLLDTDLYFALKMPLAKALYRLIDQRRREAMSWSVDAVELRNLLAMSKRYKASSRIFEVLNTAHRALKREKFLESVTLDGDTIRYKVHRDFARDWFEEPDQPTSLRWQAVQALKAKGVYPNRARTLVESYGAEKAFHVLDVLSVREGVINEGAWVANVMDEGDAEELAEMSEFVVSRRAGEKVAGSQPSLMAGEEESSVDGTELPRLASDAAAQEIWEKVLEVAREEIDVSSLRVWFDGLWAVGCDAQRLTIGVPNSFAKDYIESRFGLLLTDILRRRIGEDVRLEMVVGERVRAG